MKIIIECTVDEYKKIMQNSDVNLVLNSENISEDKIENLSTLKYLQKLSNAHPLGVQHKDNVVASKGIKKSPSKGAKRGKLKATYGYLGREINHPISLNDFVDKYCDKKYFKGRSLRSIYATLNALVYDGILCRIEIKQPCRRVFYIGACYSGKF